MVPMQSEQTCASRWSTMAMRLSLLVLVFVLPLAFNPLGYEMHPQAKAFVFYAACFMSLFSFVIISIDARRIELPADGALTVMAALAIIAIVSTVTSISPRTSFYGDFGRFEGLISWLGYIWLAMCAYMCARDEGMVRWMPRMLAGAVLLTGVLAIAGHHGIEVVAVPTQHGLLVRSGVSLLTVGDPAAQGAFFAFALPVLSAVAVVPRLGLADRLLLISALAIGVRALIYTAPKLSWAACIAAFLGIVMLRFHKRRPRATAILGVALLLALVLGAAVASAPAIKGKAAAIAKSVDGAAGGRALIWRTTLDMVAERPLVGWGPDAYAPAFTEHLNSRWEELYEARLSARQKQELFTAMPSVDNPGNFFLHAATAMGLPFMLLLVSLFAVAVYRMFAHSVASEKSAAAWGMTTGALAGMIAWLIVMQASTSTVNVSPVVWTFMGLALGIARGRREARLRKVSLPVETVPPRAVGYLTVFMLAPLILLYMPVLADTNYRLAQDAVRAHNKEQAVTYLNRAELYHSWDGEYSLQKARLLVGLYEAVRDPALFVLAEDALKNAERLTPENPGVFFYKGQFFFFKARYCYDTSALPKAEDAYRRLLRINPRYVEGHERLGIVLWEQGRRDEAMREWKTATDIDPASAGSTYNMAAAYEEMGENDKARALYKRVISIDPSHEKAHASLDKLSKH